LVPASIPWRAGRTWPPAAAPFPARRRKRDARTTRPRLRGKKKYSGRPAMPRVSASASARSAGARRKSPGGLALAWCQGQGSRPGNPGGRLGTRLAGSWSFAAWSGKPWGRPPWRRCRLGRPWPCSMAGSRPTRTWAAALCAGQSSASSAFPAQWLLLAGASNDDPLRRWPSGLQLPQRQPAPAAQWSVLVEPPWRQGQAGPGSTRRPGRHPRAWSGRCLRRVGGGGTPAGGGSWPWPRRSGRRPLLRWLAALAPSARDLRRRMLLSPARRSRLGRSWGTRLAPRAGGAARSRTALGLTPRR